jgi:RNA polymerase sigma factor (sigma-70 family)
LLSSGQPFGWLGRETGVTEVLGVAEPDGGDAGAVAVAAGFEDQFPALYRAGYRVAFRLTSSREEASDCAQEACARAYTDWKKLCRKGEVTPWVVRVSGNLAIDGWRRSRRARLAPVGQQQVSVAAERVDLAVALNRLPRRQREVVVLRYIADMSEAMVAESLGCSIGTVKTHASRGLAALRVALGADEEAMS